MSAECVCSVTDAEMGEEGGGRGEITRFFCAEVTCFSWPLDFYRSLDGTEARKRTLAMIKEPNRKRCRGMKNKRCQCSTGTKVVNKDRLHVESAVV